MYFYLDKLLSFDSLRFQVDFVQWMLASWFRNPSQSFPILNILASFWLFTVFLTFSYHGKLLVCDSLSFECNFLHRKKTLKMLAWSFCSPSQSPSIFILSHPFSFLVLMFFYIGKLLYLSFLLLERNCVRQKRGVITTQLD